MSKKEVKSVGVSSVYKVVLYLMAVPVALVMILGIVILSLTNDIQLRILGWTYAVGMPIMMAVLYGPISMLIAFVYNKFSKKFGGLIIELEDKTEEKGE